MGTAPLVQQTQAPTRDAADGLITRYMALMPRVAKGKYVLIPTRPETHGHGTHTRAVVWTEYLTDFLATLPER